MRGYSFKILLMIIIIIKIRDLYAFTKLILYFMCNFCVLCTELKAVITFPKEYTADRLAAKGVTLFHSTLNM